MTADTAFAYGDPREVLLRAAEPPTAFDTAVVGCRAMTATLWCVGTGALWMRIYPLWRWYYDKEVL